MSVYVFNPSATELMGFVGRDYLVFADYAKNIRLPHN